MEITVGIDVSKARLDVYMHPAGESFAVGNDEAGVAELVERVGKLAGLASIGLEASSGVRGPLLGHPRAHPGCR